ncbi:MAG: nitrous oxide reductase accessory protein NosL [Rhodospirillaceae bacterium]
MKTRPLVWLLLAGSVLISLGLAACAPDNPVEVPPPQEVSDSASGRYCGMSLSEHPGPKSQIFLKSRPGQPVWFISVRDAVAFTLLPEEPKDVAAIYVNDMGRAKNWERPEAGAWVEARQAWFVIESKLKGGMGAVEAIPFSEHSAATSFQATNGGRLVRLPDIPNDYVLSGERGLLP